MKISQITSLKLSSLRQIRIISVIFEMANEQHYCLCQSEASAGPFMRVDRTHGVSFLAVPLLFAIFCMASAVGAQDVEYPELDQLYHQIVDLERSILQEQAQFKVLEFERAVLSDHLNRRATTQLESVPALSAVIRDAWVKSAESRNQALKAFAEHQQQLAAQADEKWTAAMLSQLRFPEHSRQFETRLGVDMGRAKNTSWAAIVFWLLPSTALLALISVVLMMQEQKTRFRRKMRSQKFARATPEEESSASVTASGLIGVLLFNSVWMSLSGCGTTPELSERSTWVAAQVEALTQQIETLQAELDTLKAQTAELNQQVSDMRSQVRSSRLLLLGAAAMGNPSQSALVVGEREAEGLRWLDAALTASALIPLYTEQSRQISETIAQQEADLAEFANRHRAATRTFSTSSIAAGSLAVLVGLFPFMLARWRTVRQRRENRSVCPRCLSQGTLSRKGRQVECSSCAGRFDLSVRVTNRVCFPTVGIRGSGKTHWILEFYDQIRNENCMVSSSIKLVESGSDVEREFNAMISRIRRGENPDSTEHTQDRIPEPVLFSVRDRDKFAGRNDFNLLVFDLSGEVMSKTIDNDALKERAMLMDGFMLFLDPRQVKPDNSPWLSKEDQLNAIIRQRSEMKRVRGLGENDVLDVPVAVCIPKLDLITKHNPIGGAGHELLDELRATENKPISLGLIQQRSDIIGKYLYEMFDRWNIERTMRDNFGERFMFFPLTPVNIRKDEIGVEDLKERSYKPFGIQEPILWLLHLSGYCVFDHFEDD